MESQSSTQDEDRNDAEELRRLMTTIDNTAMNIARIRSDLKRNEERKARLKRFRKDPQATGADEYWEAVDLHERLRRRANLRIVDGRLLRLNLKKLSTAEAEIRNLVENFHAQSFEARLLLVDLQNNAIALQTKLINKARENEEVGDWNF